MKITVPQSEGEIRLTHEGDTSKVWAVKDHVVEVDDVDLPAFLDHVEGSQVKAETPSKAAPASSAKE